jgi:hypothetical protein
MDAPPAGNSVMTLPRSLKVCDGCGEIYEAEIAAETLHHESLIEHAPLLPPASCKRINHAVKITGT